MKKTIIILSAGFGSRLLPMTDAIPKSCLEIGGQSIVRRIVNQLYALDTDASVVVVGGHKIDVLQQELLRCDVIPTLLENSDYAVTNNMESCRRALHFSQASDCYYIINGDCLYDPAIVEGMLKAEGDVVATDTSQYFEESMKVSLQDGKIRMISKAIPPGPTARTSIDFYRFSFSTAMRLRTIMDGYLLRGDLSQWTEVAINDVVQDDSETVTPLDFAGARWVEVDDQIDLARARNIWK